MVFVKLLKVFLLVSNLDICINWSRALTYKIFSVWVSLMISEILNFFTKITPQMKEISLVLSNY